MGNGKTEIERVEAEGRRMEEREAVEHTEGKTACCSPLVCSPFLRV